jgi:hypothetical protein
MEESIRPTVEAEAYRNFHVQGSLLKSRLLYIHVNHGAGAIKRVLNTLAEPVRDQLSKPIYIGEWYPLSVLVMLDRAIAEVLEGGNTKIYEDLGVFSADVNLSGAYEPLVHQDVHAFLQLTAVLHKAYQDFGEAQYIRLGDMAALLQFRYPQPPPESYCKSAIGYLRRAVELSSGHKVTVRKTACHRKGDPFCEFRIEWHV